MIRCLRSWRSALQDCANIPCHCGKMLCTISPLTESAAGKSNLTWSRPWMSSIRLHSGYNCELASLISMGVFGLLNLVPVSLFASWRIFTFWLSVENLPRVSRWNTNLWPLLFSLMMRRPFKTSHLTYSAWSLGRPWQHRKESPYRLDDWASMSRNLYSCNWNRLSTTSIPHP